MKKRILALLMASALVIGLAACGQSGQGGTTPGTTPQTSTPAGGDTTTAGSAGTEFSVSIAPSPETIDPAMNTSVDGFSYLAHLNEGLMRYKWDGNGVEYGMAESYTVSEDGLVWTFTLRDDAKWSDGQPLTAGDFEYSWKRFIDPVQAAPYASDMGAYLKNGANIAAEEGLTPDDLGVKALDDKTLEVTLSSPCPFFDQIAAFPTFMPVRKDAIDAAGDRWTRDASTYISAGPYKFVEMNMDQNLIVEQNEHYYDRDKLVATKITFQFLADQVARLNALQSGAIVFSKDYPQEEKATLVAAGMNGMSPQLGTYYISLNTQKAPFDDINVRKAFILAIDQGYISDVIRQGDAIAANAFVGPGFLETDTEQFRDKGTTYFDAADYEQHKADAAQALADAGYPGGEGFPQVEYMYNNDTNHKAIGEAMQAMWKDVLGVQVELVNQEWNVFQDSRRKGNFDMARDGWIADYNDPIAMLTIFQSASGNNNAQYKNPAYDAQLEIAATSTDREERMAAMHKAEDIIMNEEYVCAPIYYYPELFAFNTNFKGYVNSPLGAQFFHMASYEG